jgi:WD40 repeat protein
MNNRDGNNYQVNNMQSVHGQVVGERNYVTLNYHGTSYNHALQEHCSPAQIVCIYAQNDEVFYRELRNHLILGEKKGPICWLELSAGTPIEQTLLAVQRADLILLLISPSFFVTSVCHKAMESALAEQIRRGVSVAPVLARAFDWKESDCGHLKAFPENELPIAEWEHKERAYENISASLVRLIPALTAQMASLTTLPSTRLIKTLFPAVKERAEPHFSIENARPVADLAISSDGKTLISGSKDHTVEVWDLSTGTRIHHLQGHEGSIRRVAISSDGKTLASGSQDHTVKVWDLSTGTRIHNLQGHKGSVECVAISSDGKTLISGSRDGRIRMWNLSTGELRSTLKGDLSPVICVAISRDGKTLVSGGDKSVIIVWDLSTGTPVCTLEGHSSSVTFVEISSDGKTLISGSPDCTVKVWNLSTGMLAHNLQGHERPVRGMAISRDGKTLASGGDDHAITVWDLSTGDGVRLLNSHNGPVASTLISSDQKKLISGSIDGTIKMWDLSLLVPC